MEAEGFEKKLTNTDISYRLSFPTEHLNILPQTEEERGPVEFQVRCGDGMHTFRCIKRRNGAPKPAIEKGWSDVVQTYGLQVDDVLKFYKEPNHNGLTPYRIEVYRWVSYTDELGTSTIRQRIV